MNATFIINHWVPLPSGLILNAITLIAILVIIYWKLSRRRLLKLASRIPGPPGYPIIGNALDFIGTPTDTFNRIYNYSFKFETIGKFWIGPKLFIFLMDPRDIELILNSHVHIDKSDEYEFFKPWLGNGLLISTGYKWQKDRKLIAPTFHTEVLKTFVDVFNQTSQNLVAKLESTLNETIDCHDYMSETTVEILSQTVMGIDNATQQENCFEYATSVLKMCDLLHKRHTKLWLRLNWIFNFTKYAQIQKDLLKSIHGFTMSVIKRKREQMLNITDDKKSSNNIREEDNLYNTMQHEHFDADDTNFETTSHLKDYLDVELPESVMGLKRRTAFLDLLLEASEGDSPLSDEEIKEQVDTIMFEGHDTTAAGSSFFFSLMAIYPDVQEKITNELEEIFNDEINRPITFADTMRMKYLERCILETLRLYPPVPIIARKLKDELKLVSGNYTIPSGATVIIATFKLHRNSTHFPNPEKFNPDNFLPENSNSRHYYSFVPFSAGPRSCVGRKYAMLKLKILLATVLRKYKVTSEVITETKFRLKADIILKRNEGFPVKFERRY